MMTSASASPALEWRDLTIAYRSTREGGSEVVAVDGVSLAVERGGTVGLAGESGCGKSTMAASVLRLLPRSARVEGGIWLAGEDVTEMTFGRLRAVRWTEAAIVFQGAMHSLNPVRTVGHQILEALELHGRGTGPSERRERVTELLALVDLPPTRATAYPHELSGGQKQRVMIAMALACDPEVIIADEPTTALDVVVQAQVLDVLGGLVRDRGLTLVMISHDLAVLAAVCERIVVMRHGRIVEQGPSREILAHPTHEHTRELAAAFPVIGDPGSRRVVGRAAVERYRTESQRPARGPEPHERPEPHEPSERHQSPEPHQRPELRERREHRQRPEVRERREHHQRPEPVEGPAGADDAPLLEVVDLTVDFRSRGQQVRAVDGVSLQCRPGEIVALVGQSGSGKTTLARTVLGLQRPTRGEVRHRGVPLPRDRAGLKAYRRQVQFVLQDPSASLNPKHTVYESVAEGIRIHRLPGSEPDRVVAALAQAELTPPENYLAAIPQELSGGQRQRVVIAGALALQPSFLVADEPVASLDASVRGEILGLLLDLQRELGLGALVITHDLGLAWNIADRVVVMHQGRLVEDGPVEQVLLDPQHEYTRSLLEVVPSQLGARG